MKSLKDILNKHKIPGSELSETRHQCASIASQITHIKIKPSQVDFNDGCVSFSVPTIIKTEILVHQKKFIKALSLSGIKVSSIR